MRSEASAREQPGTRSAASAQPVVIGSSLSGLLVSDALSRAGIQHLLIGGPRPGSVPRLGESMNECAGPELWRHYHDQLADCFYPKHHISLLNGPFASLIHLGNPRRGPQHAARSVLRGNRVRFPLWRNILLHVDRVEFDRRLYDIVRSRPTCRFIEGQVERIDYQAEHDMVHRIILRDGTSLDCPQYVFDATGTRGTVATAAGVGQRFLSNEQRVVWAHYRSVANHDASSSWQETAAWWNHGTNLLRLHAQYDKIDGIAWLIPLGATLSLGLSVASTTTGASLTKEQLMELLAEAFARRGLNFRIGWPQRSDVQELSYRCFLRDRAAGGNWLLVGGTFVQIWFPSSAGVWTSTAAAGLAPSLLKWPRQLGAYYEHILRELVGFHEHLTPMVAGPPFTTAGEVYGFWSRWLAMLPRRISGYLRIANNEVLSPRPRDWWLEWISDRMLASPRLQLTYWGMPITRVCRQPQLSRQAEAFGGYFNVAGFRLVNYARGLPWLFGRLGMPAIEHAQSSAV